MRKSSLAAIGALLIASVVSSFSYLNRFSQLDDALIYHRYVRNLLEGGGLVYNAGERLNALTSPLFSYLSILGTLVLGRVQEASIVIAGITLTLAVLVWWATFAASNERGVATILGASLAISFPYLYKVYGMETPLFLLLIGVCLYLFESRNELWLGIAASLLLLTRAEGVFLLTPMAAEHLRQKRPVPSARSLVIPGVILAAHFVFTYTYYGALMPHTAMVKIHQGQSGLWGSWPPFARIGYQIDWFFGGNELLALLLIGLAALGIIGSRHTTTTRIGIAFLVLYTGFYVFLSLPNYHWYYAPYYMFGYFWAGMGVFWLWQQGTRLDFPFVRKAVGVVLVSGTVLLLLVGTHTTWQSLQRKQGTSAYRQIGEWLDRNSPQSSSVAAMEIGTVGWYSRRYMIDIVGLVTPENDRLLAAGDLGGWLELTEPDYVVTHLPEWKMERAVRKSIRKGEYRPVEAIQPMGFRLLKRTPLAGQGGIGGLLMDLRESQDPRLRSEVIAAILAGDMGPVVELADDGVIAANVTPDLWTRGSSPAAILMSNHQSEERPVTLTITCLAPTESLPVTATLVSETATHSVTFLEKGSQRIEFSPIPPGESRLVTVWSDKAWQWGPKSRRWLGVKLSRVD